MKATKQSGVDTLSVIKQLLSKSHLKCGCIVCRGGISVPELKAALTNVDKLWECHFKIVSDSHQRDLAGLTRKNVIGKQLPTDEV